MGDKDIGKLYSESVSKRKFDTISSRFLGEDDQLTFFDKPTTKKRAKELIQSQDPTVKGKDLQAAADKRVELGYGEQPVDIKDEYGHMTSFEFGTSDIERLNSLSIEAKNRVANLIDDIFTKDIRKTLRSKLAKKNKAGKENLNTLNKAVDMLKYSPLPLGMIVNSLKKEYDQDSPGGTLINSNIFTSPGYYPISELFLGSTSQTQVLTNAMEHLRSLGVGAGQAGPYEQALSVFDKNIIVGDKGDILLNGQLFEIKAEDGRIGPSEYPARKKMLDVIYQAAGNVLKVYEKNNISHDFPGTAKYFAKKGITYTELYNFRQTYILPLFEQHNGQRIAYEFITSITDTLYDKNLLTNPIISGFGDPNIDFRSLIHIVIRQLFAMYKNEKSGGHGAWDYLLGINARGGFAVIQTPDDLIPQIGGNVNFAEQYSISVAATGTDATRDYMFSFTPIFR